MFKQKNEFRSQSRGTPSFTTSLICAPSKLINNREQSLRGESIYRNNSRAKPGTMRWSKSPKAVGPSRFPPSFPLTRAAQQKRQSCGARRARQGQGVSEGRVMPRAPGRLRGQAPSPPGLGAPAALLPQRRQQGEKVPNTGPQLKAQLQGASFKEVNSVKGC